MIRCIIVDEETLAREILQNLLKIYCEDVDVVAQADSASAGLAAIRKYHPDLVFLDVEMPNGSGFDLLRQLDRIDFSVIFVTGFAEYAIDAFHFSATDFLLKPINFEGLKKAVEKVRTDLKRKAEAINIDTLLRIMASGKSQMDIINIPSVDGFKVLNLEDIIICEADGFCTIFNLKGKGKVVSSKNLKHYEDILSKNGFQRVHNSFLVNLQYVREYSNEGLITLTEGIHAPLGNKYKSVFLEYFKNRK